MQLYTLVCNECNNLFQRFASGELEDHDQTCPHCHSRDVTVRWVLKEPFENLASFGCA